MTSSRELVRMARAGAEDGHDPAWHKALAPDPFTLRSMDDAEAKALAQMKADEDAYVMPAAPRPKIQEETIPE